MGKTIDGVVLGLAMSGVLWGMYITLYGFKVTAYQFDPVGFIIFGPGLIAIGIAYVAWATGRARKARIAAQAMKPLDVVFFEDPQVRQAP